LISIGCRYPGVAVQATLRRHHVALGLLKATLEKHANFVQDKIDRHAPSFQQASNYVSYEEACRKLGELNKAGNVLSMSFRDHMDWLLLSFLVFLQGMQAV
jgi:glycerol-3-phosphate O-acyltransferase